MIVKYDTMLYQWSAPNAPLPKKWFPTAEVIPSVPNETQKKESLQTQHQEYSIWPLVSRDHRRMNRSNYNMVEKQKGQTLRSTGSRAADCHEFSVLFQP